MVLLTLEYVFPTDAIFSATMPLKTIAINSRQSTPDEKNTADNLMDLKVSRLNQF